MLTLRRTLPGAPNVQWVEDDVDVSRVLGVEHDIRDPKNLTGVLHFISRKGGFRSVQFTEIDKLQGVLGATEARPSATEVEKAEREEKRKARREERRTRRIRRKS